MPRAARWADLRVRAASAGLLAPLALASIWLGGWPFWTLVFVAMAAMVAEWAAMCRAGGLGAVVRTLGVLWAIGWSASLLFLRADPLAGRVNVIGLALIVWGTDIGAYLAGRTLGGPRLAPRISPGKTWSGAAGGMAASVAIAIALSHTQPAGPLLRPALLGAFLSLIGQAGDLAESALKRRCGVKDSGRLIPGHGGLLDRLDATLAVAPAAALLCLGFGPGVVLWR